MQNPASQKRKTSIPLETRPLDNWKENMITTRLNQRNTRYTQMLQNSYWQLIKPKHNFERKAFEVLAFDGYLQMFLHTKKN